MASCANDALGGNKEDFLSNPSLEVFRRILSKTNIIVLCASSNTF